MRAAKKQRLVNRVLFLLVGFLLWFAAIAGRLVHLQIYQHDELALKAMRQQQDTIEVESSRGLIYDRRMHELAVSADVQSVYANPQEVDDPAKAAAQLAPILEMNQQLLEDRLSSPKSFVWLRRKVDFSIEERLRQAKVPGIRFIKESKRFYPHKELAGQLLGFVGIDNRGLDGLEFRYDSELKGSPGLVFVQRDAKLKILGSQIKRKPVPGNTLVLNLDKNIQFIVEQELSAAVASHQALAGTAILMNPHNGEIVALANFPNFDPNRFESYPQSTYRNRAVTDVYEPGSTFKIVTIGSALDEGQLDPSEQINCQTGTIILANRAIQDHAAAGHLNYSQILAYSSNVGAIKIGLRLGAERFYQRLTSFGIGNKANVDLPGEVSGLLRKPENWSGVSNGFIAMGYEVGVTPLQMLSVVSTVANGGYWVRPRVVQKIISPEGELIHEVKIERRQVISRQTAMLVRRALEQAVTEGTGKAAGLETYRVAGKTGTAKKQENGTYSARKYIASFVGYAPAADPAFAAIVIIDEPQGSAYYGGQVAAPVFKGIAEKVLRYLEIPPDRQPGIEYLAMSASKPVPDKPGSIDESFTDVPASLTQVAAETSPSTTPRGTRADIVVVSAQQGGQGMPDFQGKNMRTVIEECTDLGIEMTYHGFGVAVDQAPAPGTRLVANMTCKVWFARPSAARGMSRIMPAQRSVQGGRVKLVSQSWRKAPSPGAAPAKADGAYN